MSASGDGFLALRLPLEQHPLPVGTTAFAGGRMEVDGCGGRRRHTTQHRPRETTRPPRHHVRGFGGRFQEQNQQGINQGVCRLHDMHLRVDSREQYEGEWFLLFEGAPSK